MIAHWYEIHDDIRSPQATCFSMSFCFHPPTLHLYFTLRGLSTTQSARGNSVGHPEQSSSRGKRGRETTPASIPPQTRQVVRQLPQLMTNTTPLKTPREGLWDGAIVYISSGPTPNVWSLSNTTATKNPPKPEGNCLEKRYR